MAASYRNINSRKPNASTGRNDASSMVIVASGTSTYGVSLKRSAVIPFHTGDAANTISDHRNLAVTLTMMPSRGVR